MAATIPQRIQQHTVWANLADLEQILTDAGQLLEESDPDVVSAHVSLVAIAKYTRTVLKRINPVLIPESQLDAIDLAMNAIYNAVQTGVQQNDADGLTSAWSLAPPLLAALAVLPVVKSRNDMAGMTEAVGLFHQRLAELLAEVQTRVDDMYAEVEAIEERRAELTSEISSQKGVLANAIRSFETQFAADQEARSVEYTAALDAAKASMSAADEQATKFYNDDEDRHIEQMKRFQAEFDELKTALDTASDETATAHIARADDTLASIGEELDKAKHLVEMIGEVTMTGHYQKNAIEQKESADRWRLATVGVGGLAVISATTLTVIGVFFRTDQQWTDYASHFSVTIALSALAAFLGAQSLRHRHREESYRSLELELATLDPFLSSMDDEERHKIKSLLSTRYFVGIDPPERSRGRDQETPTEKPLQ